MIAQPPEAAKRREEVPAEVSKRGVMIVIEGALSSRRKRAEAIIAGRRAKAKDFFSPQGGGKCRLFFNSR